MGASDIMFQDLHELSFFFAKKHFGRKPLISAIISALSNLSIQYNFQAIAIALAFMDGPAHIYPASPADLSLLQSLVFAGAITGQLAMG